MRSAKICWKRRKINIISYSRSMINSPRRMMRISRPSVITMRVARIRQMNLNRREKMKKSLGKKSMSYNNKFKHKKQRRIG